VPVENDAHCRALATARVTAQTACTRSRCTAHRATTTTRRVTELVQGRAKLNTRLLTRQMSCSRSAHCWRGDCSIATCAAVRQAVMQTAGSSARISRRVQRACYRSSALCSTLHQPSRNQCALARAAPSTARTSPARSTNEMSCNKRCLAP
jgi:hypothetical protein